MTVLTAIGLVVAFLLFPLPTLLAAAGSWIAGLSGAVVGAIIGFVLTLLRG